MLNEVEIGQIVNEQIAQLNILFTQHFFQTQNLIAIIKTVQLGHMHFIALLNHQFFIVITTNKNTIKLDSKENFPE